MAKKTTQKISVEKDRYLPNFSIQLEAWENAGIDNQFSGQVMMTVPWFNVRNQSSLKEAEALNDASVQTLSDVKNRVKSQWIALDSDIRTTKQSMDLYQNDLIKNAQLSLSSFQKAFEVDKASFLDYFEAEKTLFGLEKDHAKLLSRYHTLISKFDLMFEKGVRQYAQQ